MVWCLVENRSDGKIVNECNFDQFLILIVKIYNYLLLLSLQLPPPQLLTPAFFTLLFHQWYKRKQAHDIITSAVWGLALALAGYLIITQLFKLLVTDPTIRSNVLTEYRLNRNIFYENFLINIARAEDPRNTGITHLGFRSQKHFTCRWWYFLNPSVVSTLFRPNKTDLGIVMQVGIPLIALMIMYAGFYVTARGTPPKLTKAREALVYSSSRRDYLGRVCY